MVQYCKTATIGFPRIGGNREMKKALEDYWAGKTTKEALLEVRFVARYCEGFAVCGHPVGVFLLPIKCARYR